MMSKNNYKSGSDEDLRVFQGRVLTLLGSIDAKVTYIHSLVEGDMEGVDSQESGIARARRLEQYDSGEWEDG